MAVAAAALYLGHCSHVSPAPAAPAATSADAKDCLPSLASGGLSVSDQLRLAEGPLDAVEVEGGGKRKDHTGAGGTVSSPEVKRVGLYLIRRRRRGDAHRKGVKGRVEGWSGEVCRGWEGEGWGAEGRRGLKQGCPVQLVSKLKRSMLRSRGEVVSGLRVSGTWGGANRVRGGSN